MNCNVFWILIYIFMYRCEHLFKFTVCSHFRPGESFQFLVLCLQMECTHSVFAQAVQIWVFLLLFSLGRERENLVVFLGERVPSVLITFVVGLFVLCTLSAYVRSPNTRQRQTRVWCWANSEPNTGPENVGFRGLWNLLNPFTVSSVIISW